MRAYLLVSIALYAAASPIVKWLVREGGETGLTAPGAISFCNVLFVGNLVGGLLVLAHSGPRRVFRELAATSRACHWWLALNVLLAMLIPSLLFLALETAAVTNIILLSRVEPVAFALFAGWFFGTRVTSRQWRGYGLILAGAIGIVSFESRWMYMRSDFLIVAAAILQAFSACASKRILELTSRKVLVFLRTFLSAVVFFCLAIALYGFEHFSEAFVPGLWLVMTVYALFIVVIAQFTWFKALDALPTTTIAAWIMISPLLGLLFAFLLLGEVPNMLQGVAAVIILAGMAMSRNREEPASQTERTLAAG